MPAMPVLIKAMPFPDPWIGPRPPNFPPPPEIAAGAHAKMMQVGVHNLT